MSRETTTGIGAPDHSNVRLLQQITSLSELGEVVRRLGGASPWDGRGIVLWFDNFECGIGHWSLNPTGAGSSITLTSARSRNGRYSLRMVGGSGAADFAEVVVAHPTPAPSISGLELHYMPRQPFGIIDLTLFLYDGTNRRQFTLRYDDAAQTLYYRDSAGVFQSIATTLADILDDRGFNTMKLVVNPATGRYVRAWFNDNAYDLATFSGESVANTTPISIDLLIRTTSRVGQNDVVLIDDVIFTINE